MARLQVTSADRVITLELSRGEAAVMRDWLAAARTALRTTHLPGGGEPPFPMSELFGMLSAVAEAREYGGH
jgi:hypothetical protein